MIYRVQTRPQLDLFAADLKAGIADIIREARLTTKTVDQVYAELEEHVSGQDTEGLWFLLHAGVLRAWCAAKIYFDCGRKTGAVTWAWASPQAQGASVEVLRTVERWAEAQGAPAIYCTRRTRLKAWDRLLRRYGWHFEAVVYVKEFTPQLGKLGEPAATGQEDKRGAENGEPRALRADDHARLQPAPADGGGPPPARADGADGPAAEHGDRDP